jgi:hypothetical protein
VQKERPSSCNETWEKNSWSFAWFVGNLDILSCDAWSPKALSLTYPEYMNQDSFAEMTSHL